MLVVVCVRVRPSSAGSFSAVESGRSIGHGFATPHEAALEVARHLGPRAVERLAAAAEADAARVSEVPQTQEEVRKLAATEGLSLLTAPTACGYKGVTKSTYVAEPREGHRDYVAKEGDCYLGTFFTAAEAALAVARHIGVDGCRNYLASEARKKEQLMSAAEAIAAAAAEGLTLEIAPPGHGRQISSGNEAVLYKNVTLASSNCASRPYRASIRVTDAAGRHSKKYVGAYATAEQAALEIARFQQVRKP